jgi:hypothetical protein
MLRFRTRISGSVAHDGSRDEPRPTGRVRAWAYREFIQELDSKKSLFSKEFYILVGLSRIETPRAVACISNNCFDLVNKAYLMALIQNTANCSAISKDEEIRHFVKPSGYCRRHGGL